ncbi:hypothetical protein VHUM_00065 [Vanrija humicola]|uniref:Uncharacterized protein n=1 Tax=Vanrija humicola TaxID=5417 RepID=A0A7D8Z6Q6_VANHU|nr:hypothetical protein VHUM_00065 [Vanrija humicola]
MSDKEQRTCRLSFPPQAGIPNTPPEFTIQPHPATTNNPADLAQGKTAGLVSDAAQAFNTPGVQQLSDKTASGLEQPKTREQVRCVDTDIADSPAPGGVQEAQPVTAMYRRMNEEVNTYRGVASPHDSQDAASATSTQR